MAENAIPWYKSSVQIAQTSAAVSTIVALFPKAAIVTALGLSDSGVVTQDVTYTFGVIALLASIAGIIVRKYSKLQPTTLTQAAADSHPATLANAAPASSTTKGDTK